jgi:hypothetical protein
MSIKPYRPSHDLVAALGSSRTKKKRAVIEKLLGFFEKYFGLV